MGVEAASGEPRKHEALLSLIRGLKKVLRSGGLPIRPSTAPDSLLSLDGVTARSVSPDEELARVDALDRLVQTELRQLGLPDLRAAAGALFGIGHSRGDLTTRRRTASERAGCSLDHFRKRIEPKIVEQLAWQLHQDSLQYVQRLDDGRPFAASGDAPTITPEHITHAETAEREAMTSEVWSKVYALRAALIRREMAGDNPDRRAEHERHIEAALLRLGELLLLLDRFLDRFGDRILHGAAAHNAAGLVRLAGWNGDLAPEEAQRLRLRAARRQQHQDLDGGSSETRSSRDDP